MIHVLASSDGPIFPITTSLAGCREGSYTTRLYKPQENLCHSAWDITPPFIGSLTLRLFLLCYLFTSGTKSKG